METIFNFVCQHADQAQWIMFFLLLLAGFNIPISEDAMLIIGGALASTCVKHPIEMWAWLFLGCWISAWEAYWIGRLLGPKLYDIRWFKRIITPKRIEKLRHYYEKFGIFTFIVGRFVPGGIRNALFMTTGLSKMPFSKFLARDVIACLISSSTLFYLGFQFGEHHDILLEHFKQYEHFVLAVIAVLATILIVVFWRLRAKHVTDNHTTTRQ